MRDEKNEALRCETCSINSVSWMFARAARARENRQKEDKRRVKFNEWKSVYCGKKFYFDICLEHDSGIEVDLIGGGTRRGMKSRRNRLEHIFGLFAGNEVDLKFKLKSTSNVDFWSADLIFLTSKFFIDFKLLQLFESSSAISFLPSTNSTRLWPLARAVVWSSSWTVARNTVEASTARDNKVEDERRVVSMKSPPKDIFSRTPTFHFHFIPGPLCDEDMGASQGWMTIDSCRIWHNSEHVSL